MSIGFNWFKKYEIVHQCSDRWYGWYELKYLDGGSTSHSAGNVRAVQHLFEKYGGISIPRIDVENIDSVDYDLGLIEPAVMIEICDKILSNTECDICDMRFRIEYFKKLSEQGYYLTYDFW